MDVTGELPYRLAAQADSEETKVHEENRTADHHQTEKMDRFDHGKEPQRFPDRLANRRRFTPFEKRQQHGVT
jgi:hypothetical protein